MNQKRVTLNEVDGARLGEMLDGLADGCRFSESEWSCLADISNGTYLFEPDTIRFLHADLEDAEASYFEKWQVDRGDMLSKLASLDSLSRLAVACRCRSLFGE